MCIFASQLPGGREGVFSRVSAKDGVLGSLGPKFAARRRSVTRHDMAVIAMTMSRCVHIIYAVHYGPQSLIRSMGEVANVRAGVAESSRVRGCVPIQRRRGGRRRPDRGAWGSLGWRRHAGPESGPRVALVRGSDLGAARRLTAQSRSKTAPRAICGAAAQRWRSRRRRR